MRCIVGRASHKGQKFRSGGGGTTEEHCTSRKQDESRIQAAVGERTGKEPTQHCCYFSFVPEELDSPEPLQRLWMQDYSRLG